MKPLALPLLLAIASSASAHHGVGSTAGSGGQHTMAPDSLPAGKFYAGLRIDVADYEHISDRTLREAAERGHSLHAFDWTETVALDAAAGVADRLMVGLSIPYRRMDDMRHGPHHHHEEAAGMHHHEEEAASGSLATSDPDGLGDIEIWAHLSLLDGPFRFGLRAGIEIPTGDTNDRMPDGEYIAPNHQAGSGSWDFLAGVSAGYAGESWAVQAALTGRVNTRGVRDFEVGDSVTLSVGGGFRVLGEPGSFGLAVTADAWGEWHGRNREDGRGNPDSGGFQWYVSPGVRVNAGPVILQLAVPVQLYNGINEEPDQRLRGVFTAGITF
ncbi:MAG: hypothetical protein IT452_02145 [Planctomycetia bacterium]|nr:hypothetical protein [Planctomycetia bacterium]